MPIARLVVTATGVIYGTTVGADTASDNGTIFSLTPSSSSPTGYKYSVLHRFSGASYLGFPEGGLASDGNALYGVTKYGGTGTACKSGVGCGTVFKFVP